MQEMYNNDKLSGEEGLSARFNKVKKDRLRFHTELIMLKAKARDEQLLRNKYPALNDAWEKYQITLELIKGK